MNEIELLVDFHKNAARQGPGSEDATLRALNFIDLSTKDEWSVADIGCGTGAQTLTLAEHIQGQITAVDLFSEFLQELESRVLDAGLKNKVITLEASMEKLPFDENTFDVIWSEGAIYNMGFRNGIRAWKKYLKPGGYLAVSEITWTTSTRPVELQDYWDQAYPEIDTASNKMKALEENGYAPVGYFVLPPDCWIDHYYTPIENRFDDFLNKYNDQEQAKELVEKEMEEIRMYKKYMDYYSYGFYLARKI